MKNLFIKIKNKIFRLRLIKENYFASVSYRNIDAVSAIFLKIFSIADSYGYDLSKFYLNSVLEIGTGKIASMPFVFKVLGSSRIMSIDIDRQLNTKATKMAIENSKIAHRLLSGLSPNQSQEELNKNIINVIKNPNLENQDNITYIAPLSNIEMAALDEFSMQYSYTVVEHIPLKDLGLFFDGLFCTLKQGGISIHYIDFYNHHDPIANPFGHLKEGSSELNPSENSCGLSLDQIIKTAENSGFKIAFQHPVHLEQSWSQEISQSNIKFDYTQNGGVVSAILALQK